MKGFLRLSVIVSAIAISVILLSQCMNNAADQLPKDIRGGNYAGAATCIKCHQDIARHYAHNSHGLTSSLVTDQTLLKQLAPGKDEFVFNEDMKVKVEKKDDGIYQVGYYHGKAVKREKMEMALGSGEKAFTYAYWKGKKLYELPLSYFSAIGNWANSPGFPNHEMYFDRAITSRCLACHTSYVQTNAAQRSGTQVDEQMERGSIIYGIDCERCHGPAKQHVVFHLENPDEKKAQYITSLKALSRKQKMDACGTCHSGNDLMVQKATFTFQPGDLLEDYFEQDFVSFGGANPDVHGNQSAMLKGSNCYRKSKDLTCQSCHNTHESIKGNLTVYSQRCLNCHQNSRHSQATLARGPISSNCIDCHMPKEASKLISFQIAGKDQPKPYLLRSHRIGIYEGK
ncbi:multiheme c-type cytochrome [Pedobacter rhizosphaerae]|uniref:Cytochrome c554 and c-prime n=1 Tax=Pedobacter rhizosphaerae TaxID=390241 RepID=A0A1H9UC82_9SPHI|nr:multiheme c-type cytochrome [Pedobacter rhizosphaerae]SES06868.1 Cytochrome c554 and c-prime [Pedobacter rhizosphaerae]